MPDEQAVTRMASKAAHYADDLGSGLELPEYIDYLKAVRRLLDESIAAAEALV